MSEFIGLHTPLSWLSARRRSKGAPVVTQGVVALCALPRVAAAAPAVVGESGECRYRLAIAVDSARRLTLDGEVEATLPLTCQRCLQPMAWPVAAAVGVTVVETEQAFDRLEATREPLLLMGGRQRLSDVIEEELLLAMPLAPMHADGDRCAIQGVIAADDRNVEASPVGAAASGAQTPGAAPRRRPNPFAVLASLKKES